MGKQSNILLVEDDINDVLLFKRALSRADLTFHLNVVHDGDEAIDYLAGNRKFANREKYPIPDGVILDIKLPFRTGFEVLDWIRHNSETPDLKVMMLSSSDDPSDKSQARKLRANGYTVKPMTQEDLCQAIIKLAQAWSL
jgi:CheY-like chemotaxis protein